jgi:hypothetical protein
MNTLTRMLMESPSQMNQLFLMISSHHSPLIILSFLKYYSLKEKVPLIGLGDLFNTSLSLKDKQYVRDIMVGIIRREYNDRNSYALMI